MILSKHQCFKLCLQILFMFVFSVSLLGCSSGGGDATTTDPNSTDPTTPGTGDIIFTGAGVSALPSSAFSAVSFNEVVNTPSLSILEWISNDNTSVSIALENNIVRQIFVADKTNTWVADSSFVTINASYDGAVVTFTDQTLFEGDGAAGNLILNGTLTSQNNDTNIGGDSVNNTSPSLADVAGVWDVSETVEGTYDEMYLVIRTDGSYLFYDYLGDSYEDVFGGGSESCYLDFSGTINDLGAGDFLIDDNYVVLLEISDGDIISTEEGGYTEVLKSTSLHEFDLAPICDWWSM